MKEEEWLIDETGLRLAKSSVPICRIFIRENKMHEIIELRRCNQFSPWETNTTGQNAKIEYRHTHSEDTRKRATITQYCFYKVVYT